MGQSIKNPRMAAGTTMRGRSCQGKNNENTCIIAYREIKKQGGPQMGREKLKRARMDAELTQQQIADKLGITLRHYQKIEYAELNGSFEVWDALEDLLGVHQRILRETSNTRRGLKESRQRRQES